jgi:hypothetical protein
MLPNPPTSVQRSPLPGHSTPRRDVSSHNFFPNFIQAFFSYFIRVYLITPSLAQGVLVDHYSSIVIVIELTTYEAWFGEKAKRKHDSCLLTLKGGDMEEELELFI